MTNIRPLKELTGIEPLVLEAERQGFRFMRRLVDEWASGANRFDRPGEFFFGVFRDGALAGVGGLNRDPFVEDPEIGRLRHVYVLNAERGSGAGKALVRRLLAEAPSFYTLVRLRTQQAAGFYERLGFEPIDGDENATHIFAISGDAPRIL